MKVQLNTDQLNILYRAFRRLENLHETDVSPEVQEDLDVVLELINPWKLKTEVLRQRLHELVDHWIDNIAETDYIYESKGSVDEEIEGFQIYLKEEFTS